MMLSSLARRTGEGKCLPSWCSGEWRGWGVVMLVRGLGCGHVSEGVTVWLWCGHVSEVWLWYGHVSEGVGCGGCVVTLVMGYFGYGVWLRGKW